MINTEERKHDWRLGISKNVNIYDKADYNKKKHLKACITEQGHS